MFGRAKRKLCLTLDVGAYKLGAPALHANLDEGKLEVTLPFRRYRLKDAIVVQDANGVHIECSGLTPDQH